MTPVYTPVQSSKHLLAALQHSLQDISTKVRRNNVEAVHTLQHPDLNEEKSVSFPYL